MVRYTTFAVILLAVLVTACTPTAQAPVGVTPSPGVILTTPPFSNRSPLGLDWDDRTLFASGLVSGEQHILDELPGATVYHIDLQIDPTGGTLSGIQGIQYTNRADVPLDEVYFRLFPNLLDGEVTVRSVQLDGEDVAPEYTQENSVMRIELPESLAPGQQIVLTMQFEVEVPPTLEANYGVFSSAEDVLALAHFYPMIPPYDDEGWHIEPASNQGDVTFAESSFYVVRVAAPADWVLAAAGVEIDHTRDGDRQIVTYALGPARDFYMAASQDYIAHSTSFGQVTITTYALAGQAADPQLSLEYAAAALEFFQQELDLYPYTEFDVVSTPTLALGIEYPSIIAFTSRDIPAAYHESTIVHEVGHQWFYNLVGNDQLNAPWLDESLVQYLTWQYYGATYGSGGLQGFGESLQERWARVEYAPIPIGLPVAEYTGPEYSAIVYGRGALFFDALRDAVGQDAFDAFLRDYAANYRWAIATPQSLQMLAESHCQCDLTPLFDEWVTPD